VDLPLLVARFLLDADSWRFREVEPLLAATPFVDAVGSLIIDSLWLFIEFSRWGKFVFMNSLILLPTESVVVSEPAMALSAPLISLSSRFGGVVDDSC
jgi:hypothetical protein